MYAAQQLTAYHMVYAVFQMLYNRIGRRLDETCLSSEVNSKPMCSCETSVGERV